MHRRNNSLLLLVISAVFLFIGCSRPQPLTNQLEIYPTESEMLECAEDVEHEEPIVASYWKPGTLDASNLGVDEFTQNWYSSQLCAMGEPMLSISSSEGTQMRFLWLRSFHPGIAVRITRQSSGAKYVAVELSGAGGYAPGTVSRKLEGSLSADEWSELQTLLSESGFWDAGTTESNVSSDGTITITLDGAQWIIEVAERGRYHIVVRNRGGQFRALGKYFLELSQLDPDPIY